MMHTFPAAQRCHADSLEAAFQQSWAPVSSSLASLSALDVAPGALPSSPGLLGADGGGGSAKCNNSSSFTHKQFEYFGSCCRCCQKAVRAAGWLTKKQNRKWRLRRLI